jgi:hypothetical protein
MPIVKKPNAIVVALQKKNKELSKNKMQSKSKKG